MGERLKEIHICGLPLALYLPLGLLTLGSMYLGLLPDSPLGTLLLLMVLGGGMQFLGDHLPILRSHLGGGTVLCLFSAAVMAHLGWFPAETREGIDLLMGDFGFLDLFIAALLVGSILSMPRQLLLHSAPRFLPVAFLAMAAGVGAVLLLGIPLGYSLRDLILYIAVPMMSGGMGAGVVPLSNMYAQSLGLRPAEVISRLIPASTLGNIAAILTAALLNQLGRRFPALSGDGRLVRGMELRADGDAPGARDIGSAGLGLLLSLLFLLGGTILGRLVPAIHSYAWMILLTAGLKAAGVIPDWMSRASGAWSSFVTTHFTSALLIGIGASLIDLSAVSGALTPSYLLLILAITAAVTLGAALGGRLVGFYPIESAITAGLCTINMGGSGNIAILSASRRMELLSFAQLATRICGALVLVLSSLLLRVL